MTQDEPYLVQYSGLLGWEKRTNHREYLVRYNEGLSYCQGAIAVARARALYLSWRACIRGWANVILLFMVADVILQFAIRSQAVVLQVVGIGVILLLLLPIAVYRTRLQRRRNPNWQRYRRRPEASDWHDYGDLADELYGAGGLSNLDAGLP